ncbi:hypothetical protein GCM10023083_60530 [Streptomyces phyllanthi]
MLRRGPDAPCRGAMGRPLPAARLRCPLSGTRYEAEPKGERRPYAAPADDEARGTAPTCGNAKRRTVLADGTRARPRGVTNLSEQHT